MLQHIYYIVYINTNIYTTNNLHLHVLVVSTVSK